MGLFGIGTFTQADSIASAVKDFFDPGTTHELFTAFVASFSLVLCPVFFAFTMIPGWNYYGERCVEYLFNRKKSVVNGYPWLYIPSVFIGSYMTVAVVWNIADIFNALMASPNLIALLALSGAVRESRDYFTRLKQSK